MYNASFYPTPPEVAEKMLAKVGKLYERSILEPSAGKGDLADAAVGKLDRYYNRCREVVHCIEIEPELQAAIRGKGYPLVGTDFLTFWPDEKYDLILMNPPFANGDAHLLHAWEILDHGDIVCLLNEQTLLNPCTSNRKLLATIIEEHGEVEHLGSCFAEDALRKTQVRVSMVHLRKKREEPKFSFDAGSDEEGAAVFSDGSRFEGEVATRDTVGNLVAQYGRCRELFVRIAHLAQELAHYAGPLGTDGGETVGETLKELMRQKPTRQGAGGCVQPLRPVIEKERMAGGPAPDRCEESGVLRRPEGDRQDTGEQRAHGVFRRERLRARRVHFPESWCHIAAMRGRGLRPHDPLLRREPRPRRRLEDQRCVEGQSARRPAPRRQRDVQRFRIPELRQLPAEFERHRPGDGLS